MTAFALEAAGLHKSFGALKVTDGVTLCLPAGARTALIGPNGAGKTTLVGLLSGTIRPNGGRILLGGRDITRDGLASRVQQGLVRTFQVSSLFAKLTVLENVFLAKIMIRGDYSAKRTPWIGIHAELLAQRLCLRAVDQIRHAGAIADHVQLEPDG